MLDLTVTEFRLMGSNNNIYIIITSTTETMLFDNGNNILEYLKNYWNKHYRWFLSWR